jgi:hypothetical protein
VARGFLAGRRIASLEDMSVPQIVTQHLVAAVVCLLGLSAAGGKRPAIDKAQVALDLDGLGPAKVGMSVEEAEQALGVPLSADREHDPGECYYVENRARLPGAALMVIGGRVVRADVYDPGPRTAAGIGVGSSEEDVERAYPSLAVRPHPYTDEGHYLIVDPGDGRHLLILESNGKVVSSFRAGERVPVSFIDGCE